jgi:hypothetical protein
MMNNAKQDAVFVQPIGGAPKDASKSTASDRRLAAIASALTIALELAGNGVRRALEHLGYIACGVILLNEAGQSHTFFWLKLLIAFGWRVLHLRTLQGWQVLHFTFESALSYMTLPNSQILGI